MVERVLVHGLVVESAVPLEQGRPAPGATPDLRIALGAARAVPQEAPRGQVLAQQPRPDESPFYTVTRCAEFVRLRCHGVCDVVLDHALRDGVVHVDPDAPPGLESVVLGGMGLALVLQLRGHLVLHASAVEVDGGVIAFVGRSGMGKSTLATLLAAAGARLVTDDVLRADVHPEGAVAHRGSRAVRLRPAAGAVAPPGSQRSRTADGRQAVSLDASAYDAMPLLGLVVPHPDRSAEQVRVDPATPADALIVITSFPRLLGWRDGTTLGQQFELTAELVRRVPLGIATLPWGPPFPQRFADDLAAQIDARLLTGARPRLRLGASPDT